MARARAGPGSGTACRSARAGRPRGGCGGRGCRRRSAASRTMSRGRRQHAEADLEVEQPDPAQGGGARLVEEVVGGVDGLVEADGRHRVAEADERGLHGDLLDEQRQSAGRAQQAAYLVGLLDQVDRLPAGGPDAAQEHVDGRPLSGPRSGGTGSGPTRTTDSPTRRPWSGPSPPRGRRWWRRGRTGGPAQRGSCRGRARRARAGARGRRPHGRGRPTASRRVRSPRRGSRGRRRGRRRSCAGCARRPRGVAARGDVPHEQRLAAAGRTDDGHPPGFLQCLVQRALDVVATEAGGQHAWNLSLLRAGVT